MTGWATLFAFLGALGTFVTAWAALRINNRTAGRAFVQLNMAGLDPIRATLFTVHDGKFRRSANAYPLIEMAQVVVENPGRSDITIRNISLRLTGTSHKKHTVTPRVFLLENMGENSSIAETYKRIGAYDRATYLLDFWSVVDTEFDKKNPAHKITLRAEVGVAGHKKAFRSKAKWTFYPDTVSASKNRIQRRVEDILLTELIRGHTWDRDSRSYVLNDCDDLSYTAELLSRRLSPHSTLEEIRMARKKAMSDSGVSADRPSHPLTDFEIHRQLRSKRGQVVWPPNPDESGG